MQVRSRVRKIPWRRKWQPTPVFLHATPRDILENSELWTVGFAYLMLVVTRGSLVTNFRNQFFNVSKVKFITKILEAHRMDRRLGISSESRQKPRCSAVWGQEVGLIGILLERRERGQACLVVKGEAPYVSPGVSREHLVASAPLPCERGRNSHWHPLGLVEGGLAPGFRDPWRKYLVGVPFFPKKKEKVQWC